MNAVRVRRDSFVRESARLAAVVCLAAAAAGCKSGSWMAKPSWMTFGQKAPDAAPLTQAPAFSGAVPKPSASAQPYPTTSTPEGYALPDAAAQAATAPGAAPAAVTYGSTPPPAAAPTTVAAAPPTNSGAASPIAPQVGPYAQSASVLPPEVPAAPASAQPSAAAWTSPGLAAVPPAAAPAQASPPWPATTAPAAAAAAPPPRFADARAASPAWNPPASEPPPADGRYGSSGTSRFGGASLPAAAGMLPAEPSALPAAPVELQPAAQVPAPPAAPLRRPDPGYRPGGTSSYRPARSSLADPAAPGVQHASFETEQPLPN